jgi:hypothetical protein
MIFAASGFGRSILSCNFRHASSFDLIFKPIVVSEGNGFAAIFKIKKLKKLKNIFFQKMGGAIAFTFQRTSDFARSCLSVVALGVEPNVFVVKNLPNACKKMVGKQNEKIPTTDE